MIRRMLLAACLLAAGAAAAAPTAGQLYKDLTPGPYQIKIRGMLTQACARAIETELARHFMISKAEADFEKETAVFTIKPNGRLSFSELKSILKRASKRMKLSTYEVVDIRYMPSGK
ncbi:MAG: heavy-metal-associated domain-containing protein [Elusimicrobia bacterium]|nr:heavy-metal-associated domain-containing protein [Elusimicrobiota bacterium]